MQSKAWLTVPFMPTPDLRRQTHLTLEYLPNDYIYKVAIVNHGYLKANVDYMEKNDKNILSRAWNKGLKHIFSKGYKEALVTNLDIILDEFNVDRLYEALHKTNADIISATMLTSIVELKTYTKLNKENKNKWVDMQRNDGSFSCFIITKDAFESIGDFDENFVPAYFEDDDYFIRAKKLKKKLKRCTTAFFFHDIQQSLKSDPKTQKEYYGFMKRNQEYLNRKHGINVKMF